jgi:lipid-A-disaccharide synthase
VKIPWIGLVNIVANETVVPELLQDKASAPCISKHVLHYLTDPKALSEMRDQLARVRSRLGAPGVSRRAAQSIAELLTARACGALSRGK